MNTRTKNGYEGGVEVSSINPTIHSNKLVVVRYRDHVLLRNANPKLYFDVNVREAVGWLTQEEEFIVLTSDRSVDTLLYEIRENVLFIIKSNILDVREVK